MVRVPTLFIAGEHDEATPALQEALLEGIAREGSISAAGRAMNMSYKRAWELVADINESFAEPLVAKQTGGSGGGLLTNWTITQTTRFAAAVSQRDIASWTDWWYTADFTLFHPSWFKAPPFEDPEDFRRRSPITYVSKIQTPLMFILGEVDWRTPRAFVG